MPRQKADAKSIASKYQLYQQLEGDAFAERWLGEWEGQLVLVKYLQPLDETGQDIWQNWGKNIYRLRKTQVPPSIQLPIAWGLEEGAPYLVLPYLEGQTLASLKGQLDEKQLATILLEMSEALSWLHNQWEPILHLSIHPQNILLAPTGQYKLLDVGLTGPLRLLRGPMKTGLQTHRGYLASEYFDAGQSVGPEADIFALGASLYEAASGQLPLGELGGKRLLDGGEIPRLPENFSPRFNQILQVMLAKGADRRPDATTLVRLGEVFRGTGDWQSVSGFSFAPSVPYRSKQKLNLPVPELGKPRISPAAWRGIGIGSLVLVLALGGWLLYPSLSRLWTNEDPSPITQSDLVERDIPTSAQDFAFPMEPTVKELLAEYLKLNQMLTGFPQESQLGQSDRTFLKLTRMKITSLEDEMLQRLDFNPENIQEVNGWKGTPDAVWLQDALSRVNRYLESLNLMDIRP